jgi:pimeloyl-ACP methyl ester carboxylesterase
MGTHFMRPISAQVLHRSLIGAEAFFLGIFIFIAASKSKWPTVLGLASIPFFGRLMITIFLNTVSTKFFGVNEATRSFSRTWFELLWQSVWAVFRNQWSIAFPPSLPGLSKGEPYQPIIALIHGYSCNAGCFGALLSRLSDDGASISVITLTNPIGDLEISADETVSWLQGLASNAPYRPIILVGISMGGIVARLALTRPHCPNPVHLVTISAPHRGTHLAYFGIGTAARQLQPGSEILMRLANTQLSCPTTSVWTPDDGIILPSSNAKLTGADIVTIPGYTHLAVAEAPAVEQLLIALRSRYSASIHHAK